MDALQMFLLDHARAHSSAVAKAEGGISIADFVLSGLDDDQIRSRPSETLNSLAWLLWHMARTEDMAVNLIIGGGRQVLEEQEWCQRLNIDRNDMAAGMTDEEVADFSASVDVAALREYRVAVGRMTRDVVGNMRAEELEEVIDPVHIKRAFSDGTISESAGWLKGFMGGKTKAFLLGHAATGHNFMHLGEAFCLRSLAGLKLPV